MLEDSPANLKLKFQCQEKTSTSCVGCIGDILILAISKSEFEICKGAVATSVRGGESHQCVECELKPDIAGPIKCVSNIHLQHCRLPVIRTARERSTHEHFIASFLTPCQSYTGGRPELPRRIFTAYVYNLPCASQATEPPSQIFLKGTWGRQATLPRRVCNPFACL